MPPTKHKGKGRPPAKPASAKRPAAPKAAPAAAAASAGAVPRAPTAMIESVLWKSMDNTNTQWYEKSTKYWADVEPSLDGVLVSVI